MSDQNDSMDWTPGECCRQSALIADSEDTEACIVILLERGLTCDEYNTRVRVSGLKSSESVALLEIIKQTFIKSIVGN